MTLCLLTHSVNPSLTSLQPRKPSPSEIPSWQSLLQTPCTSPLMAPSSLKVLYFQLNTTTGTYLRGSTLTIGTPKDFTVEIWFRPNLADAIKGQVQTLIEKADASGTVRFGIGVTDRSARIVLNGIAQEVHWPTLLHPEHFITNQSYSYASGGRTYTPPLNNEWRMLSATFRWAES